MNKLFVQNLILILICIFLFFTSFAQTAEETLAHAQANYAKKSYDEAIEECERVLFFEVKKEILARTHYQLAQSHLQKNNGGQAYDHFNNVQQYYSPADSVFLEAEFGKIMSYIAQNETQFAVIPLMDLRSEMTPYFKRKKLFYSAVVNFKINSFAASERDFIDLLNNEDSMKVKDIFRGLQKIHRKTNPRKAKILSMLLPGAGQLYLGDYKNAAKSFLLNGAIGATAVYWAGVYTVVDAYFFTASWFFRYYRGGFLRAESEAQEKIVKTDNLYLNQLLDLAEKTHTDYR